MNKKKLLLLIIVGIVLICCYCLFYKSYSTKTIPKSADIVLSIDVKKNENTILAYILTTPKEWNLHSILHFNKDTIFNWKDAISIPDYVFIFHSKDQPEGIYYCILSISNEEDFKKGLYAYDFKEISKDDSRTEYYSNKIDIDIIKKDNQILIGYLSLQDKAFIQPVAEEIFTKNEYIDLATLKKIVAPPDHFSIYIKPNDFLQEETVINGNFNNEYLTVQASLQPRKQFSFTEDTFYLYDRSLLNLAFAQPSSTVYSLLPATTKASLTKAFSFSIDSLLNPSNRKYCLTISGINNKTDSSVSYTFDDNFNKTEKVVVNKIQEPCFNFTVCGKYPADLFRYWIKNKNIELTNNGNLFVSNPFVKTFAKTAEDSLSLSSYNYTQQTKCDKISCIGCFNINSNKIPLNLINYFPDYIAKLITNFESVNCIAKNDNGKINITLTINSRVKGKPFLLSFK